MIQLELRPEIESQLAAEAQARGLALDRYIETLVAARPISPTGTQTAAEAVADIRRLRKGVTLGGLKIKDLIVEGRKY
jgi:hypothetical protein